MFNYVQLLHQQLHGQVPKIHILRLLLRYMFNIAKVQQRSITTHECRLFIHPLIYPAKRRQKTDTVQI